MKRLALSLFSVLLAFLVSCSTSKPERGISFDTQKVNIGVVYPDSAVRSFDLTFTNTGRQDLRILDLKTDCDCTTGKYSSDPVRSGEKGKVTITVDLRRFFPQPIEKKVAIYSDATKKPVMIDIVGEVKYHH